MISFPNLAAEDIEVRVAKVNQSVVELLLYKDARCDMRILDEVVGNTNWQRKHDVREGKTFCTVSIREDDEWINKEDCGSAGQFEPEKSAASDAFKRACFSWGIGRELYTAPRIAIWWNKDGERLCNCKQNDNGKWQCFDSFKVSQIIIDNHVIKALSILDEHTGKYVYRYDGRDE